MDTHHLRQFEEAARHEARAAETVEDFRSGDSAWGVSHAAVYESFAGCADMLARVAGAFPLDPHYVRAKTVELLSEVTVLSDKVMMPPACAAEIPSGVDRDGTYLADDCLRPPGHSGEHSSRSSIVGLADRAADVLRDAIALASRVRWVALAGEHVDDDSRADVADAIRNVQRQLDRITKALDATTP